MGATGRRWRAFLLLGVLLVAGCSGGSVEPSGSATVSAAASLQPLTRDEAISAARVFAGAPPSAVVVGAEAGPFAQFEPSPNAKMSPPPADQWVWHVEFRDSSGIYSDAIIDYLTGALVETSRAITN
jgi:hypothetical protein